MQLYSFAVNVAIPLLQGVYARYEGHSVGIPDGYRVVDCVDTKATGVVGLLYKSENDYFILAYRGTERPDEWHRNMDALFVESDTSHGYVHKGFQDDFRLFRDAARKVIKPIPAGRGMLVGHSLGGPRAFQTADDHKDGIFRRVITFGSPRLGLPGFADGLERRILIDRFENECDVVPLVPTAPPFKHSGRRHEVRGGFTTDWHVAHALTTYSAAIKKLYSKAAGAAA